MATQAQLRANNKYQERAYDQISLKVPKGEKVLFQRFAEEAGLSLREYIRQACYEKHDRR